MFQQIQDPVTGKMIYRIAEKHFWGNTGTLIAGGGAALSRDKLNLIGMSATTLYLNWNPTSCTSMTIYMRLLNEAGFVIQQTIVGGVAFNPLANPFGMMFELFPLSAPFFANDNIIFNAVNNDPVNDIMLRGYIKGTNAMRF